MPAHNEDAETSSPYDQNSYDQTSPVERLLRWEEMGAIWRVLSATSLHVTISLLRCDGGEELERIVSDDPDLLAFVAVRSRSDELLG